jgi:hypothetical protein
LVCLPALWLYHSKQHLLLQVGGAMKHEGYITSINDKTMTIRLDARQPLQFSLTLFEKVRPTISIGDFVEVATRPNGQVQNLVMKERATN